MSDFAQNHIAAWRRIAENDGPDIRMSRETLRSLLDNPPVSHQSAGMELIAAERQRQIDDEGYTPEHDDEHDDCELGQAATAYVFHAISQVAGPWGEDFCSGAHEWPFADGFNPSDDPVRNLVKAGALIAAEIERLGRKIEDELEGSDRG